MRVCPKCFTIYGPNHEECSSDSARLLDHKEVLIGLHLGPYIIRSMLSEGGMGVVFAAEHPALGRRVAIKVLRPELSLREDIVERFIQEARAVNTIGHANIVSIYDFGKTPFGTFYIVMEYLDGRTLRGLLDQTGPQPPDRVRWVLREVGAALSAAHGKGFIHRDVKPANIMVCRRSGVEQIKLLDFGIVKLVSSSGHTELDAGLGTPQYMSPEQLDDARVDRRTDVYALGAVVYEMLTGQTPYRGASHAAVRHAQTTCQPPPPSICRRDVHLSPSIDQTIVKAIDLDANNRFDTIDSFVTSFEDAYQDTLRLRSAPPPRSPNRRRQITLLLAIGTLLVAAGAAGALLLRAGMPPLMSGPRPSALTTRSQPNADAAARRLGNREAAQLASKILQQALTSPITESRRQAIADLRKARSPSSRQALIRALTDDDAIVRRTAALALGELGQRHPAVLKALRQALARQMSLAAIAVAKALAQLGDPSGMPRLRRELTLAQRQGPRALRFALEALAEFDSRAAQQLRTYLDRVDWADRPQTRARLLARLAAAGDERARQELKATMRGGSGAAQLYASVAWATLDKSTTLDKSAALDKTGARKILHRIVARSSPELQAQASVALLCLGDTSREQALLELLDSPSGKVKAISVLGLARAKSIGRGHMHEGRIRKRIAPLLRDHDSDVQLAAAVAVAALK